MVRYRPDPRAPNSIEMFRWQATLGPFRRIGFYYNYYKFFDHALKYPSIAIAGTLTVICSSIFFYKCYSTYNEPGYSGDLLFRTSEKLFEHSQWATDSRKVRGEWNNNFGCWSGDPDCGKDFKKRYFS